MCFPKRDMKSVKCIGWIYESVSILQWYISKVVNKAEERFRTDWCYNNKIKASGNIDKLAPIWHTEKMI